MIKHYLLLSLIGVTLILIVIVIYFTYNTVNKNPVINIDRSAEKVIYNSHDSLQAISILTLIKDTLKVEYLIENKSDETFYILLSHWKVECHLSLKNNRQVVPLQGNFINELVLLQDSIPSDSRTFNGIIDAYPEIILKHPLDFFKIEKRVKKRLILLIPYSLKSKTKHVESNHDKFKLFSDLNVYSLSSNKEYFSKTTENSVGKVISDTTFNFSPLKIVLDSDNNTFHNEVVLNYSLKSPKQKKYEYPASGFILDCKVGTIEF